MVIVIAKLELAVELLVIALMWRSSEHNCTLIMLGDSQETDSI